MVLANEWKDYTIISSGNGDKLEQWGNVTLLRPDPQVIWQSPFALESYSGLDARYLRDNTGGGKWEFKNKFKEDWCINYKDLTFSVRPTSFKHTGLFPEQSANWDIMRSLIKDRYSIDKLKADKSNRIKVLNLFAYTGGASVSCAKEKAFVTHVDASKGMTERAKLNANLSKIPADGIRYILDDCKKFVEREIRRGNFYDAVLMDPPSYGRGTNGEIWKLEESLYELVNLTSKVLAKKPIFFLLNSYTTGLGASVMKNILHKNLDSFGGGVKAYELCLPTQEQNIVLPCGNSALWVGDTQNEHFKNI